MAITVTPTLPVIAATPGAAAPGPALNAAASIDLLAPLERAAVAVASETAVTLQGSQAPLFANLGALAASSSLPPALQQAIVQVLTQRTSLGQNLDGGDIQSAFQKSGLFLEA